MAKNKLSSQYKVIPDPKDPVKWCVQLNDAGDWTGIVYSYGEFSINEPIDEESKPMFKFEIDVIFVPERLKDIKFPDEKELEFRTLLGQILFDIIQTYSNKSSIKDGKLFIEFTNEN